ncbi:MULTISPECIES: hypothetical protein [Burkholderia]|uniref:hypothetical protein n=1 Tax=Burkholderia TaxID=32008 RepID=UPI0015A70F17|nr:MULTISPECIES: hypothetical protein [Burkholderia]
MTDDGPDYWMAQQAQEELEIREALEANEQMRDKNASKKNQDRWSGAAELPAEQDATLPD